MPITTKIEEDADLTRYPAIAPLTPETEITIGDLHGNALKFIYFLVKEGVLAMDKAHYERMVAIYRHTSGDLASFKTCLQQATINSHASTCLIRLMGDELADRGKNDYFTLEILKKLGDANVPVEVIISNHSVEFIRAYEGKTPFVSPGLGKQQAASMYMIDKYLNAGVISRSEVEGIINEYYKPTLKAMSYTLSDDKKQITIYSHAPIGLTSIKLIAEKMQVAYKDQTAENLARTIDGINNKFRETASRDKIFSELFDVKLAAFREAESQGNLQEVMPIQFLIWNRDREKLAGQRPVVQNGYHINFAHGHDRTSVDDDEKNGNIINLDNVFGKGEEYYQGDYRVLQLPKANELRYAMMNAMEYSDTAQLEDLHRQGVKISKSVIISPKLLAAAHRGSVAKVADIFNLLMEMGATESVIRYFNTSDGKVLRSHLLKQTNDTTDLTDKKYTIAVKNIFIAERRLRNSVKSCLKKHCRLHGDNYLLKDSIKNKKHLSQEQIKDLECYIKAYEQIVKLAPLKYDKNQPPSVSHRRWLNVTCESLEAASGALSAMHAHSGPAMLGADFVNAPLAQLRKMAQTFDAIPTRKNAKTNIDKLLTAITDNSFTKILAQCRKIQSYVPPPKSIGLRLQGFFKRATRTALDPDAVTKRRTLK